MKFLIRLFVKSLLSALTLLLLAALALGQTTAARPDRGFMPGASYSVSDVENISLTNGNVNLSIPLASLPPIAGGKLKLTLNAIYNSKQWNITRKENQGGTFNGCPNWVVDTPQVSDVGGWTIGAGYRVVFREVRDDFDYAIPDTPPGGPYGSCEDDYQEYLRLLNTWRRAVLVGPDGAEHELRPTDGYLPYGGNERSYLFNYYKDTPDTINAPMRYYSFDGSFLWVVINPYSYSTRWTIYMNDGTKVVQLSNGIQRITDTNGNSIKIYADTEGAHYQDEQTGREIKYTYDPAGNNGKGQGHVLYQTVGGTWKTIDINFDWTRVQGKLYRINDWQEWGGETGGGMPCFYDNVLQSDLSVIKDIVFPVTESGQAALKYSFGYNSDTTTTATDNARWACGMAEEPYVRTVSQGMGGLSQMDTPSGATAHYSYSRDGRHSYSLLGATDDIPRETITQKTLTHDGFNDTWNYSIYEWGACGGTVTAPDGSVTIESCYPHDSGAGSYNASLPKGGLVFKSNNSNKQITERHWTLLQFTGANTGATGNWGSTTFNPVVDVEYTTLLDNTEDHTPVKMSAKAYQYDYNGNVIQETYYDWFDPSLVIRDSGGEPMGVPASATVLRVVNTSYYNDATNASSGNVYAKRSLSTETPLILNANQQTTAGPAVTQYSYDGFGYGTAPTIGNLTSQKSWDDIGNKWITSSQAYGAYGNLATKTDARGKVTQLYYDDATHALPNRVGVDPQNGTGTQINTTAYDYWTGLVTSQTDPNNNTSTIDYTNQQLGTADPFGRPGVVVGPLVSAGGANQRHRVTSTYEDNLRRVIIASDLNTEGDKLLKTRITSDMLGRPILTERTEEGTNYTIASRKAFAQMDRITFASNPARTAAASTDGWTRITNDSLGRTIEVATFGGATQPPATGINGNWTGSVTTGYDANFTTITDQAGKVRRTVSDALGRLVRVDEPDSSNALGSTSAPVQPTSYTYSSLGNLVTVTQGAQTRTSTYDSLSRLRTVVTPESGTISYNYDDNGNLLTKQDARSVTTTFTYDAINRCTTKTYTDGTPRVDYFYDSQALPGGAPGLDRGYAIGRLVAVTYGGGSSGTFRGYNAVGAVVRQYQQTDGINYLTEAAYHLNGSLQSETYPSVPGYGDRRTVSFTNDSAGRLASLSSNATSYAPAASLSGIAYGAHNRRTSQTLGNSLIHAVAYNSRLQPNEIKLGTSSTPASVMSLVYDYGTTNNNGNVLGITYNGGGLAYAQTFTYDSLNRLVTSQENGGASWSETNGYDRFGNRWIDLGGGNQSVYISPANNRISSAGYGYDAAGNLTTDGAQSYTFDAENRIIKVDNVSAYVYDGQSQRVRKLIGDNLRFVYGISGKLIAEFDGSNGNLRKEYIHGATGLVATIEPTSINSNGTRYLTSDSLGSTRVITNFSAGVVSRYDYKPFGEELSAGIGGRSPGIGFGVADGFRHKFTSKERDNETGLDYFGARYYGSMKGRFASVDPILITEDRLADPQAINLYAYVRNNPLKYIDPDGKEFVDENGNKIKVKKNKKTGEIEVTGGKKAPQNSKAVKDLQKMAALVNKSGSKTAASQFMKLSNSSTKIHFAIESARPGDPGLMGVHEAHDGKGNKLTWDGQSGMFNAKPAYNRSGGYKEASITLFEDSIQNNLPYNRALYGDPGITKDEAMVSTFAHEAEHDLNKKDIAEIKGRYEGKGTHYDVDDFATSAAYKMSRQVFKEIP